jgi:MFS family permease
MSDRITSSSSPRHGVVLGVVCLALAAVVAAMSSLNVGLPDLARDTHATQTQLLWVIDAYSLAFAALLLPGGALGDRYGRRMALIAGLVIFGVGSAVAMTANSATELIGLRAVIGLGAALVMPATLSTITGTFPAAKRTRAVSVWAAVAGGAAIFGLLVSGALLTGLSWRSIFGVNVVLAALALVGTLRFVPESADPDAPRLDVGGAILAVLGLTALVFSVIEAPTYGWLATRTIGGLILALVLLTGFIVWELHQTHPLLNPRIFRQRPLSAGSMSIFVQFFPLGLAMVPTSRLAPALVARFGSRRVCAVGLVLVAAGLAIIAQLSTDTTYLLMAAGLLVLGVGMGAAMTPATSAITEGLPASQQGVGSAMNDLSREVGGAIGIAVLGSILAATYSSHVKLAGLTGQIAAKVKGSYAVASTLAPPIPDRAHSAFVAGMNVALLTAAGAALVAAVGVVILLARKPVSTAGAGLPESEISQTASASVEVA